MSNEQHYADNKKIIGLTEPYAKFLKEMKPIIQKHADNMVDQFYAQLDLVDEARALLDEKPGRRQMLRHHLKNWLIGLTDGSYDLNYQAQRYVIGQRHVAVGIEPWLVVAAMSYSRSMATKLVDTEYANAPDRIERILALSKVMDLDLNIMLQSYEDKRIDLFLETTGFSRALFEQMIKSY